MILLVVSLVPNSKYSIDTILLAEKDQETGFAMNVPLLLQYSG
jgi:hypothetical protein